MAPPTPRDALPSRGCPLEPRRSRAMHPATFGSAFGDAAGRVVRFAFVERCSTPMVRSAVRGW